MTGLPHKPDLLQFTTKLEEESRLHVERMNQIRNQREKRQPFSQPYIPAFPPDYYEYIPPWSINSRQQKRNGFTVGENVLARWFKTKFFYGVEYSATIVADNGNGTYSVAFNDGDNDTALEEQHIRLQSNKKKKKNA